MWFQLSHILFEIFENPCRLLHKLACLRYSLLLTQIHITRNSRKTDTIVKLSTKCVKNGRVRRSLALVEAIEPDPLCIDLVASVSKTKVFVQQHGIIVLLGEQIEILVKLLDITLIGRAMH